jgi:hypothetical protein
MPVNGNIAPKSIVIGVADPVPLREGGIAVRVSASGLRCSRGSYRQHATQGIDGNKGDPSGSSASL